MPSVDDHLAKQIYIDKNVVTFRSLSRQFSLHVNAAKNELAKFHAKSANAESRTFATYLVSGELLPTARSTHHTPSQTEGGMEVDSEAVDDDDVDIDEEEVPLTTMMLVGENDLELAKSSFARILSTHVYCLSPSPLTDAGLICDTSSIVYRADATDAPASSIALGRVVGPDVRASKAVHPAASSSKVKAADSLSRKPTLKAKSDNTPPRAKAAEKEMEKAEQEQEKASTSKHKATGKLDWSKARKKSYETDKNVDREKVKKEEASKPSVPKLKVEKTPPVKSERDESPRHDSKRGTKRKATPLAVSDTEEKTPTPALSDIKIRRNRIVSDDEEEDEPPRVQPKVKGKPRASLPAYLFDGGGASMSAMWDVDDSQVEMASATRPPPKAVAQMPKDEEDIEMASEPKQTPAGEDRDVEEDKPKPKPRKKKEKKVIPVGRNGLKKKRVMKSRMTTDAKGYMVTEDYSSYESVDEEEAEQEAKKKPKGKKATAASSTTKVKKSGSDDETSTSSKPKPVARTNSMKGNSNSAKTGGQGNLKDFFAKK